MTPLLLSDLVYSFVKLGDWTMWLKRGFPDELYGRGKWVGSTRKMDAVQEPRTWGQVRTGSIYREASKSSPYFLLSLTLQRARGATEDCSEFTSLKELEGRTRLVDGCSRVRGLTKSETNRGERPHRLPTAPLQARPEMLNHCPNPLVRWGFHAPCPRAAFK